MFIHGKSVATDSDCKSNGKVLFIWNWCTIEELLKWQFLCGMCSGLVQILLILQCGIFLFCFSLCFEINAINSKRECNYVIYLIILQTHTFRESVTWGMAWFSHCMSTLSQFICERKHNNKCTGAQYPDVCVVGITASYNNLEGANKKGESIIPYSQINRTTQVRICLNKQQCLNQCGK